MPARTERQRRYMAMCAKNPKKSRKRCPPKKVAREFMRKKR